MENKDVPFIVHEGILSRMERQMRRLFILLIIAILAVILSNALWLYAWMQYDYSGNETVTVDGRSGTANYIGEDGIISNGEDSGRMSRRSYYDDGMSYDEGEMYVRPDGTYARRSMKRDGMGRYARSSGDVVGQLKDMMYGADERTRSEIQKLISKLEK